MNVTEYPYVVYVPRDFDRARKWPVILFLHGAGERGSDGLRPTQIGLSAAIRSDPSRISAIAVFPQVPADERWIGDPADAAIAALDRATKEFNGDRDRTYLTGLSMGGYGTIHLALAHLERFAALVVVCGGLLPHSATVSVRRSPLIPEDGDPYAFVANALRGEPIWLFHGADDQTIPADESRHIYAELQKAGAKDAHYTEYPGVGHNAWDKAYFEPSIWQWLFAQRRRR
ncbi:MAG TPA: alpha/beta hydrolase-fold protein [Thermoanaerobaculia bacterium]